jgi:hypothetical protein
MDAVHPKAGGDVGGRSLDVLNGTLVRQAAGAVDAAMAAGVVADLAAGRRNRSPGRNLFVAPPVRGVDEEGQRDARRAELGPVLDLRRLRVVEGEPRRSSEAGPGRDAQVRREDGRARPRYVPPGGGGVRSPRPLASSGAGCAGALAAGPAENGVRAAVTFGAGGVRQPATTQATHPPCQAPSRLASAAMALADARPRAEKKPPWDVWLTRDPPRTSNHGTRRRA